MAGNTFGRVFRLTTFGESHGAAVGGILDGCPAGLKIDEAAIQKELDLRRPGSGAAASKRQEADRVQIFSGVFEGVATGTPIAFYIANTDQRSRDYAQIRDIFRPGHADWSYYRKYNGIRDYRGGGRASGRETAARVAAGAVAKMLLGKSGVSVEAAAIELGGIAVPPGEVDSANALGRPYFAASDAVVPAWDAAVARARAAGDTLGGVALIIARHVPPGLGEPVFDKLDATLAHAVMSVGAVKGVEIGSGFAGSRLTGSQNNDVILPGDNPGAPSFASNNAGGILGGVSSGQDIVIRAAIKPIASIGMPQDTIDTHGRPARITIGGRHDLAAIPRAVPVLSAMVALALADALLLQKRMEAPI